MKSPITRASVAVLCAVLILVTAVSAGDGSLLQVHVKDETPVQVPSDDFIIIGGDHQVGAEVKTEPDDNENDQMVKPEDDLDDLPAEDRETDDNSDDNKSGNSDDDTSGSSDDIPGNDRMATGQSTEDSESPDSSTDGKSHTRSGTKIPAVMRAVAQDAAKEDDVAPENLPEMERKASQGTSPPRKRYVKQSDRGNTETTTVIKPRKTVTVGLTNPDKPSTSSPKGVGAKPKKTFKRPVPGKSSEKNKQSESGPRKTPEPRGPRKTPHPRVPKNKPSSNPGNKPDKPDPSYPRSRPPTTGARKTSGSLGEKTCPCYRVANPKMECYSFTNESKGSCRLRMCGSKWECLTNGYSKNICIRKYAKEKIELIPGTSRCHKRKHAPKAYWVFYRKYNGPKGYKGKPNATY